MTSMLLSLVIFWHNCSTIDRLTICLALFAGLFLLSRSPFSITMLLSSTNAKGIQMKWLLLLVVALSFNAHSDSTIWHDSFSGNLSSDASSGHVTYWYGTRNLSDMSIAFRCDLQPGKPKLLTIEVNTTVEMSFNQAEAVLTLSNGRTAIELHGYSIDVLTALFPYDNSVRLLINHGYPVTATISTTTPFGPVKETTAIIKRNFELHHPLFKGCDGSSDQLLITDE